MEPVYYLIGTDEAGYGPNLGPLLVSAALWRFTHHTGEIFSVCESNPHSSLGKTASLFDQIDESEEPVSVRLFEEEDLRLTRWNLDLDPICGIKGDFPVLDSKRLYHTGQLERLERSFVLAAGLLGIEAADFFELLERITGFRGPFPVWEQGRKLPFPLFDQTSALQKTEKIRAELDLAGAALLKIQSRRIQPAEFNGQLAAGKLKSDILAEATMQLAYSALTAAKQDALAFRQAGREVRFLLLCDKLGGRNRYLPLLQAAFTEKNPAVFCETLRLSRYELDAETVIRFQAKGESNRPTALASIVSKYLRERSMEMFNQFWQEKIPNISPTAGYPEDARRFLAQTAEQLPVLGISMHDYWRNK